MLGKCDGISNKRFCHYFMGDIYSAGEIIACTIDGKFFAPDCCTLAQDGKCKKCKHCKLLWEKKLYPMVNRVYQLILHKEKRVNSLQDIPYKKNLTSAALNEFIGEIMRKMDISELSNLPNVEENSLVTNLQKCLGKRFLRCMITKSKLRSRIVKEG